MPTGDLMRRVMNLLLLAVSLLVPLNTQTHEPTWDSVDKRPLKWQETSFHVEHRDVLFKMWR